MSMREYHFFAFKDRVDAALVKLRRLIDVERQPMLAADVPHAYPDKFGLAEFVTNLSLAAQFNVLEALGLHEEHMSTCAGWLADGKPITLRLNATQRCTFQREESRDVDGAKTHVLESSLFGRSESKTVLKVTEFFWTYQFDFELLVFCGGAPMADTKLTLQQQSGRCEMRTSSKAAPKPTSSAAPPTDVDLTPLLSPLAAAPSDAQRSPAFSIDRDHPACRTPRRNAQVEALLGSARALTSWATSARALFDREVVAVERACQTNLDLSLLAKVDIFVPVLPLFEEGAHDGAPLLGSRDASTLLQLQRSAIAEASDQLAPHLPTAASTELFTLASARLLVLLSHLQAVLQHYSDAIAYIEDMLRKQLVAAVGKELTPSDFNTYMAHHCKKLYRAPYAPRPFSFAVRRPGHCPEGTIALEAQPHGSADLAEPIATHCCAAAAPAPPMSFALNAATRVTFTGERYLHAYIGHEFAGASGASLHLSARARQFSSYMLLLGKIGPAATFEPKHAIVVQNKDELTIPLLLDQLPTAKEFRDAVESLSPEQQRFARAYRSMQLEGSLFAVLLVQLKPQLEVLLNLPDDSLTKEIELTQQLLALFTEHQIPSDLLSYSGDPVASTTDKLASVRAHVDAILGMLSKAKQAELRDAAQRHAYKHPNAASAPAMEALLNHQEDDDSSEAEAMAASCCGVRQELQSARCAPQRRMARAAPSGGCRSRAMCYGG
eukprot:CAMPEP_0119367568 /NCGR_PEP_ID=MMETSP1334-20130426/14339_1 /TAXON_ID=127549 /ORGANISM="Calcidiscus leptoporus, Strain RCC1130" /LENGTH=721 /DNA_ID=CAMNT_0007384007 /DNA_START=33 /DNA_END=2195 /DNA_ORIENTATION=+